MVHCSEKDIPLGKGGSQSCLKYLKMNNGVSKRQTKQDCKQLKTLSSYVELLHKVGNL